MNSPGPDTVVPVLLYHAVGPHGGRFGVDPSTFARHLDTVLDSGRRSITISELATTNATTEPLVAVSFDDGFADNLDVAVPLLAERGLRATVYVTTSYVDGTEPTPGPMLSPAGVRELHAAGVEIGSHAVHHRSLDRLDAAALRAEVRSSKAWLEDLLGTDVASFAYPHGHHNRRARREVIDAGYRSSCLVMNTATRLGADPYGIARLTVERGHDTQAVAAFMDAKPAGPRIKVRAAAGARRRAYQARPVTTWWPWGRRCTVA